VSYNAGYPPPYTANPVYGGGSYSNCSDSTQPGVEYADHVSIVKFVERNWSVPPITQRSRDNFPNPVVDPKNPYVPTNSPAISDLFDFFDFSPRSRQ
jgi:hypothetical protein